MIPDGSRTESGTLIGVGPRLCVLPRIHLLRLSEKSLRCQWTCPTRSQEAPFWPISCSLHAAQITVGALLEPLFGQSQKAHSRKFGSKILHSPGPIGPRIASESLGGA